MDLIKKIDKLLYNIKQYDKLHELSHKLYEDYSKNQPQKESFSLEDKLEKLNKEVDIIREIEATDEYVKLKANIGEEVEILNDIRDFIVRDLQVEINNIGNIDDTKSIKKISNNYISVGSYPVEFTDLDKLKIKKIYELLLYILENELEALLSMQKEVLHRIFDNSRRSFLEMIESIDSHGAYNLIKLSIYSKNESEAFLVKTSIYREKISHICTYDDEVFGRELLMKYEYLFNYDNNTANIVYSVFKNTNHEFEGRKFFLDLFIAKALCLIDEDNYFTLSSMGKEKEELKSINDLKSEMLDLFDEGFLFGPSEIYNKIVGDSSDNSFKKKVKQNQDTKESEQTTSLSHEIERIVDLMDIINDELKYQMIKTKSYSNILYLTKPVYSDDNFNTRIQVLYNFVDNMNTDFFKDRLSEEDLNKILKKSISILEAYFKKYNRKNVIIENFKKLQKVSANFRRHDDERQKEIKKLEKISPDMNYNVIWKHFVNEFIDSLEALLSEIRIIKSPENRGK